MAVRLEFDFLVEAGFYYLGRWPIALMEAIGEKKDEVFAALRPNPLDPDSLISSSSFVVQQRSFIVTFGSDKRRHGQGILRVMVIQP